jgi:hypothetical protein
MLLLCQQKQRKILILYYEHLLLFDLNDVCVLKPYKKNYSLQSILKKIYLQCM